MHLGQKYIQRMTVTETLHEELIVNKKKITKVKQEILSKILKLVVAFNILKVFKKDTYDIMTFYRLHL